MPEIVLCCGKVCSGKSTFTNLLEQTYGFYAFSADNWMLQLFEPTEDRTLFHDRLARCKELIHRLAEKLLTRGNHVALDFGFWSKEERRNATQRYASQGFAVSVVYFPIDDETQIRYMRNRQNADRLNHYTFDEQTVAILNRFFEEPEREESCLSPDEYLASLANRHVSALFK
ncbi:hypothetical protein U14_03649 [Candidatus Moduliflexus flocculans]|uniref:ATP-binding protein n=1 Tax=Candidatus Moduliflexus flocculans TaxID=1499966 RepID=A0A081BPT2_9BACT|nr:hypothetical protein U14_03649 [Candidatus Moduliflexus flocculans]